MKSFLLFIVLSIVFCKISEDEVEPATEIGKSLINDLNTYRKDFNIFKAITLDDNLMKEALAEADYLRENPDDFKEHANYDDRTDKIENLYYTEMYAKLFIKEKPQERSLNYWQQNEKYNIELKREYTKAGAACLEYSSGWMCVLELMNVE